MFNLFKTKERILKHLIIRSYTFRLLKNKKKVMNYYHRQLQAIPEQQLALEIYDGLNDFFLIWAAVLVFSMQLGFMSLEAGSVRMKNVKNIVIKNFFDACLASSTYYAFGYAFTYSKGNGFIGGTKDGSGFFLSIGNEAETISYPFYAFQFTFAATSVSIVSGAVAERCTMSSYFTYSLITPLIIYPVVAHWVWSDSGFLSMTNEVSPGGDTNNIGVIDFAGSGVVHLVGGVSALVACYMLGPRIGRFELNTDDTMVVRPLYPHSAALQAIGVFILWIGWYGFNIGSLINFSGQAAGRIFITTTISASSSAITAVLITYIWSKSYGFAETSNSILAGLVSITAGCATTRIEFSFLIGFVGAVVYLSWSNLMLYMHLDDVVDAVAVHGACGIWGVFAAALFAYGPYVEDIYDIVDSSSSKGVIYGGDGRLVAMAAVLVFSIIAWVGTTSFILFGTLNYCHSLRVSETLEQIGLDVAEHGGSAYKYTDYEESPLTIRDVVGHATISRTTIVRTGMKSPGSGNGSGNSHTQAHSLCDTPDTPVPCPS